MFAIPNCKINFVITEAALHKPFESKGLLNRTPGACAGAKWLAASAERSARGSRVPKTRVKKCGPTAGPIWVPSLQPTSNFMVASPHLGTAKSP
ncbi:hypothetical protein PCANC_08207 [Puccinia coronata f. sp. avenae]|uniref:Uncharacterized protein n=1 Tax=Puccinia coronata f. sp. avenae TaxID=200324 RepID=A0A2N5VJB2_9BASI|nr:hypothetical protein PCANC_08207 [Puccinia coronata f. sp. avenae]